MVIITTEKILKSISTDWKNLTRIQNDLKIEDNLDIRYLKLKLKEFERKNLIECKDISEEKYYKCIDDLQSLEKKDILKKNKPIAKEKPAPKKRPVANILSVAKLEESAKSHREYLKNHPYDENRKEILKKTQKERNRIKLELNKQSYYFCPHCMKMFTSKEDCIRHIDLKHYICFYCGKKFNSESDLAAHERFHEVDLHGLYIKEAKIVVRETLIKCNERGYKGIKLIHGYRHGHALKDYFRSNEFIREMKNFGYDINLIQIKDPGSTGFTFKYISKK